MKLNTIEVLSEDEILTLHRATMDLLSSTGVKVKSEEAKFILKINGAEVIDSSDFVKFPKELIEDYVKKAPDSFSMFGPDGSFKIDLSTNSTIFSTMGSPTKIYDDNNPDHPRNALMSDVVTHFKLVDQLKHISSSHLDVFATDIPYSSLHSHVLREWARYSKKPFGNGCRGKIMSQDMMDMATIIVGNEKELKNRPRIVGFFNPISPLYLPDILIDGLFVFAEYLQPVICAPAAIGGLTAPITIAGMLTQTNAETLATIVLAQMINPGVPVFYGAVNSPMDPSTGNPAWGAVEMGLMTSGSAQLASFYNIPSRAAGGVTNSNQFDMQCGVEKMLSLLNTAYSGINYITSAGLYECGLTHSSELLVIDDEFAGMASRALKGIDINDTSIALKEIKSVAQLESSYLKLTHTAKNLRKELFLSDLATRDNRREWLKNGKPGLVKNARQKIEKLLAKHEGPYISTDVEEQLSSFINKVEARDIDEYKQA